KAQMPIGGGSGSANQGEHIVRFVREGRPDFRAVQQPAALGPGGFGSYAGQIRACIGFTHADAEEDLSPAYPRQVKSTLFLRPIPQDQRSALTIAHPMG